LIACDIAISHNITKYHMKKALSVPVTSGEKSTKPSHMEE